MVDVEETSNQTVGKTAKNEAFRVQNILVKQMTLKGKYGLSKIVHTYNEQLFMFYMVDPLIAAALYLSGMGEKLTGIKDKHITVKMILVLIIAFESLASHTFGPQRVIKKSAADALRGPFR